MVVLDDKGWASKNTFKHTFYPLLNEFSRWELIWRYSAHRLKHVESSNLYTCYHRLLLWILF